MALSFGRFGWGAQADRGSTVIEDDERMTTLNQMQPGEGGRIVDITAQRAVTQRLMAMGLLPGRHVEVVRFAPLGDPITVQLDGTQVSLRRSEARTIEVERS